MNRRLALPLLTLALALGAGCGGDRHHVYTGTALPVQDLARVECYRKGTTVELRAVDGQACPENYVYLKPGRHLLLLAGPPNIAAADAPPTELSADPDSRRPVVELELEVVAGMHYFLGATLKELAFLKSRSDQTRVWEEGFYKSWTLDVYAHAQDTMGVPPLVKSYPQAAK
jgi:hypothetical protein